MDSSNIADRAERQSGTLRDLERRAAYEAGRPLAAALTTAQADALRRWTLAAGPSRNTPAGDALRQLVDYVRKLIRDAFNGRGRQARRDAERAAYNAAQLGTRQASAIAAAMRGQPTPPVQPDIGDEAQAACDHIPTAIEEEQQGALALLTTAGLTAMGMAGLNSAFQRARRAVGRIARGMAVAVTSAAANGARLVARALGSGVRLLWVAEPDACAACRAYAGLHIRPGGLFPGGLSLDPRRTVFHTAIPGPPRHPHCRCVTVPWSPDWPVTGTPLPTLLRQRARTARRS
ncbi:hypothetical protein [Streptomyces sp. M2CJ-2]|uniref:hypothetical protein n=1 Tax=Streptomyces sp. M2CJ-2 TaxID=2803948 RepID=UPI001F3EC647|nr:hypothetical protein [Streptomyces sp. M2CJ-2]